jgi:carbamoyl-phosphate synthase small subunit
LSGAQRAIITRAVGDAAGAVERARRHPSLEGRNLVREVTADAPYAWDEPIWPGPQGPGAPAEAPPVRFHVVAYDFGIKRGILRRLRSSGCRVSVVPASTPAGEVVAMKPDGIFLSNGPGDPAAVSEGIEAARELCRTKIPVFGICLGHQLMGLASGAKTLKMKFGHHGANHPVLDRDTGQVLITSQNHGFAVDAATLPANVRVTHVSLFDGSLQGIARTDRPAFSFQGHPEASPGPHDLRYLFDRFVQSMATK